MAERQRIVCASDAVVEGGKGFRFAVNRHGEERAAFVIRYDGRVRAYVNRCAHVPVQMDWTEGEFFDYSGLYLVCATHGATYLPDSGYCVAGPCKGARLVPIQVEEVDGQVWLME